MESWNKVTVACTEKQNTKQNKLANKQKNKKKY